MLPKRLLKNDLGEWPRGCVPDLRPAVKVERVWNSCLGKLVGYFGGGGGLFF